MAFAAALIFAAPLNAAPNRSSAPAKKRVVCWTEEGGRRACGDAVPPEYSAQEKKILDEKGRVVRIIPAQLTAAQLAEKEAADRQAEANQAEADRQAAYDRALIATYATPEELAALRNDRLSALDTSIELGEAAANRDEISLADLRKQLPAPDSGKKPPAILLKRIAQFEKSLTENRKSVADMHKKRDEVCSTFARDIRRFQEMKSGAVTFESPCPATGSLSSLKAPKLDLKSAEAFFNRFVELERDFDTQWLDFYADQAVIKRRPLKAGPDVREDSRNLEQQRAWVMKDLPAAKLAVEVKTYSQIKVEDLQDGTAKVSGTWTSSRDREHPVAFYWLLKPSGKSWKIVEDWAGPPSAVPAAASPAAKK